MQITIRVNWLLIPLITIIVMLFGQWAMKGQWFWYYSLNLPPIVPPSWVFSVVWTSIYILTTACALIVFNCFEHTLRWYCTMTLFFLNAFLNAFWVYVFFTKHLLGTAVLWCAMVALTTWILIALIKPVSRWASLLLIPYALWTSFATLIAAWTWLLN